MVFLSACAGIPLSKKPYVSPTSGDVAEITFKTEVGEMEQWLIAGDVKARVSETSCREVDGVDRSSSKLNKNTFSRTQNTVNINESIVIPAGKNVYISWIAKGGGGATGSTFIGAGGFKYQIYGNAGVMGVFVPQKNAKYESFFSFEKGRYQMTLLQVNDTGKSPVSFSACP